ncbi:MAG: sulfite exporter TauE/SafE family protein [Cytophagales bacterium]|nr:sulfite exporter TauE/SafE family protein [Cytophagales bacterium]
MEELYFLLFLAGLLGGFLAGLIGIGGGVIYIFILEMAFVELGIKEAELAQFTIANSIFAVFFASFSANITLIRLKQFYWRQILLVAVGSILSSLLMLHFVVNTSWFSRDKFNVVVIFLLVYMLVKTFIQTNKQQDNVELNDVKKPWYSLGGIAGGTIASLSGLGGGVVMVPIFHSFLRLDIKQAKAISLGVISVTALMMTISNFMEQPNSEISVASQGLIVYPVSLLVSVGVIISAPFGVKFAQKWSSKTISFIYLFFLSAFIIKKVFDFISLS